MLYTKKIETLLLRQIKDGQIIAIGSSTAGERFLKTLALHLNNNELQIFLVPTSHKIAELAHKYNVPLADLEEKEIDLAIEFSESVDRDFNFVKRDTSSLIRDKIIALSAAELIVVTHLEELKERLDRLVPVEVCEFGLRKTLLHLEQFGKARLRYRKGRVVKTESGNCLADILIDKIHDLVDMDTELKKIPGVVETGLFFGFADKAVLKKKKGYCIVES